MTLGGQQSSGGRDAAATGEPPPERHEYVLVGGGLQNALIALAILQRNPNARLALVEREERLGGNHTWCFHEGDVGKAARGWLEGLVVRRWPSYEVRFPGHERRVADPYSAITSERLHRVVTERFATCPNARVIRAQARRVDRERVLLSDGATLPGEWIIDARGPGAHPSAGACGYQKFLGLELELSPGSSPTPREPLLMDATVEQLDGYRFVYVLPLSATRVLVEDTYYSASPELEAETLRRRALDYAERQGWSVAGVVREETGVLPIPLRAMDVVAPRWPLVAGYAGGFFHPTTGYSLPVACRLAECLSRHRERDDFEAELSRLLAEQRRQARFCILLNRMLFKAFEPERRYHVLERFYRLPKDTIRRFYALQTTPSDRARILCGRPPRGFSARRFFFQDLSPGETVP